MKKYSNILTAVIVWMAAIIVVMLFVIPAWYFSDEFPKSEHTVTLSYTDGVDKGYVTGQSIKITSQSEPIKELPLSDFTDSVTLELKSYSVIDFALGEHRSYVVNYNLDYTELSNAIDALYVEGTDAYILQDEKGYHLVPEVPGRQFETAAVIELLQLSNDFTTPIDISPLLYVDEVTVTDLQEDYAKVSWMNDWHVSYSNGHVVDYTYLYNNIIDNPFPGWAFALDGLHYKFVTNGLNCDFLTTNGDNVSVVNKTFGYSLDKSAEADFLQKAFESKTSYDNRTPVLKGYGDVTNTYIEISKSDQHLWHYVDGVLCCETDVVTGNKRNHDTPVGVYYVSECINGKYLRGADYKTWVNKWMRLTNSGIGLHDAYWRSKFGGDIYTYDGSHGCINLPKAFAYTLYSEVSVGDRVVIY